MARISKEDQEIVKNRIIEVSRKMFNDVGFDNTSTKMIAKATGIAEGTIFNYFGTKDEIFFEVFLEDYISDVNKGLNMIRSSENVFDDITENIYKILSKMLRVPKRVLLEMGVVTIKIAKKKPEFFRKMATIDFKYMEQVSEYLDQLINDNVFVYFDAKKMSEIIFGSILYEISMYLYEKEHTKLEFKNALREKIEILLKGYIKGGS